MKRVLVIILAVAAVLSVLTLPTFAVTNVRYGACYVDGYMDPVYTKSATYKKTSGMTIASGSSNNAQIADPAAISYYVASDKTALYVFVRVEDANITEEDAVTINLKVGSMPGNLTIRANGTIEVDTSQQVYWPAKVTAGVKCYDDHYDVEAGIPFKSGNNSGFAFNFGVTVTNCSAGVLDGEGNLAVEQWMLGNVTSNALQLYFLASDRTTLDNMQYWPAKTGSYRIEPSTTVKTLQGQLPVSITATTPGGTALSTSELIPNGTVITDGANSCIVTVNGDANSNGYVETNDVSSIRAAVLGTEQTAVAQMASDINDNSRVDSNDLLMVRRFILGQTQTVKPVKEPTYTSDNIKYYGAKGNGVADDTAAFRTAIAANTSLYVPAGVYRVSETLTLPSGFTLYGDGADSVIQMMGLANVFSASGVYNENTNSATKVSNITVRDLTIEAPVRKYIDSIYAVAQNNYALYFRSVDDLTISGVTVDNLGGISIGSACPVNCWDDRYEDPMLAYGLKSDADLCNRLTITDCTIDCHDYSGKAATGILIEYAKDYTVSGCHITNAHEGIQCVGGDAAPERGGPNPDGAHTHIDNLKWYNKNGVVEDNYVADIYGGGCWGSRCYNLTIRNNEVWRCHDLGVEFEGSHHCYAIGNTVYDCLHGNLATFQPGCGTITFTGNSSYFTPEGETWTEKNHYRNFDVRVGSFWQNVTLDGNYFEGTTQTYVWPSDGMNTFNFTNNTCVNTGLNTYCKYTLSRATVTGNTFTIDSNFVGYMNGGSNIPYIIQMQQPNSSNTMVFSNNTINVNGHASAITTAVHVYHATANVGNAEVCNNRVYGGLGIVLSNNSGGRQFNVRYSGNNVNYGVSSGAGTVNVTD